jgi:hypothetical protein
MASFLYDSAIQNIGSGLIDLDTHAFKIALLTSSYSPNPTTHTQWSHVSPYEISASGYTTLGKSLSGVTWATSSSISKFDASDVVWTAATITARYAVIYDDSAANDPLICLLDFGQNMISTNDDFTIQFDANGIFRITTS